MRILAVRFRSVFAGRAGADLAASREGSDRSWRRVSGDLFFAVLLCTVLPHLMWSLSGLVAGVLAGVFGGLAVVVMVQTTADDLARNAARALLREAEASEAPEAPSMAAAGPARGPRPVDVSGRVA